MKNALRAAAVAVVAIVAWVLSGVRLGTVPAAEAHGTLCGQSGFTTHQCTNLSDGKYYTARIPFGTGNLDYPNDVYNENPTCDCVTFPSPIHGLDLTVCHPRHRAASPLDPPPKHGSKQHSLYCGTSPGRHLHTKP